MPNIYHLLYRSLAAETNTREAVKEILETSRNFNSKNGLTGLLIFRNDHFIQLLEGEEAVVKGLYGRIQEDPRHHSVQTMLEADSESRVFDMWSMAFVDDSIKSSSVSSLCDLFDLALKQNSHDKTLILPILKRFIGVSSNFL